ncbi:MAG: hypothetical protein EOO67_00335 [Microbacterium sp.]|nr:MAG: hypothetical protein EOO67_00335 [Microbacterium sp.]
MAADRLTTDSVTSHPSLITDYLRAVEPRLRARRDRDDLLDEIADHLHSAAERLEALGVGRDAAEQRALARFGEPRVVATLLTSVPSKGSTVSLFFSRYLGPLSMIAAVLWAVAAVMTYFGYTALSGSWTSERYLTSAVIVGLACLVTVAVLVGLNIRATGRLDGPTIAIGVIGVVAAAAATMTSWVVALWLPLLAAVVTWTMVRARRAHAGSRPFVTVLMLAMPLLGAAAIAVSAVGIVGGVETEIGIWLVVVGLAVVLVAALADLAVRLAARLRTSAVTA